MRNIIGTSPKILEVVKLMEKVADTSLSILITGESGTGKELAAHTVHLSSSRSEKPFIAINCAALPDSLLESELFGIEKGVATGVEKRLGKIESANGGTLFLDEIGDMSLAAQAKLLRVLQERKLERVGGRSAIDIDVRVLAATNKDLKGEVKKGNFREDLYYRLNAVHIFMPALREIKEDIPVLARHFLDKFTNEAEKSRGGSQTAPTNFSSEAMDTLLSYDWPGNVREMENEIKRAAVLADGDTINESDLSEQCRGDRPVAPTAEGVLQRTPTQESAQLLKGTVEEIEIRKIKEALDKSGGNKQKASKILGISRQGLIGKIKRYGLSGEIKLKVSGIETADLGEQTAVDSGFGKAAGSYEPRIPNSESRIERERKQVTVLFAKIHRFAELSEKLDPEELSALINKCFEIVSEEACRYEGTVSRFTGDGVMALFGAPVSIEDHSYKAVKTALGIGRRLRIYAEEFKKQGNVDFENSMKFGINTGIVVAGNVGDRLGMDYTAVGDTVSLASGLSNAADAGKIIISENTYKLVTGYFLTQGLGETRITGRSEPVKTYEVIKPRRARTRIDVQSVRGLTSFTGRGKELGVLKDCLNLVKEGRGQVVFITGEPGIGKSRLLLEFKKSSLNENAGWLEGHCASFGKAMSCFPLVEILKRRFRVDKSDDDDEFDQRDDEAALLRVDDLDRIVPYIKYLLSVHTGESSLLSMDARQRRVEIFEALKLLVFKESLIRPVILLIEDLHWMDKTSEEFLVFLADSLPAMPVLLLLTYRPGYSHPLGERTYHTRIALRNLDCRESVVMAESLLKTGGLPGEIRKLIDEKADGNPFFIEELIKSLFEDEMVVQSGDGYKINKDLSAIQMPVTIQDIIMARIDRLEENCKRTLQICSVIGREFSFNLLRKTSDSTLRHLDAAQSSGLSESSDKELRGHLLALRNSELIYERGMFLDANYFFKHALTHEAAYNSLLVRKRKELHEKAGNAVEELYAERIEEFYGVLSHHFGRTDNLEKASRYLTLAGKKAKEVFANEEAFTFFNEALERLNALPKTETKQTRIIDVLFDIENIYDATGRREEQGEILEKIINMSESANDEKRLSDGYIRQSEFFSVVGEYEKAQETGKSALTLKRKIGDKAEEGKALRGIGFINWRSGDYGGALKHHKMALDIYRELGDGEAEGFELISLGEIYRKLGEYDNALSCLQEALVIHKKLGIAHGQHVSAFNIGNVYQDMGNLQACLGYYQECWRTIKGKGLSSFNAYSHLIVPISIANTFRRLGSYRESLGYYTEALNISRGLKDRFEEGNISGQMGAIYNVLGDYRESVNHYEEALKIYRELGDRLSEGRVLDIVGNIYRQNLRDYRGSLPYYKESLKIKKEINDRQEIRSVLSGLGAVCWNLGVYEEALSYYREALDFCKEEGDRVGEGIILSGMGVVHLSLCDYEAALKCNQEALNIIKAAGDRKAEGYILNSIGNVYYETGDYQAAWKHYQGSMTIRKELGDKKGEAWMLYNLGRVYRNLENYEEFKNCHEKAFSLAEEIGEEELKSKLRL